MERERKETCYVRCVVVAAHGSGSAMSTDEINIRIMLMLCLNFKLSNSYHLFAIKDSFHVHDQVQHYEYLPREPSESVFHLPPQCTSRIY